MRGEHLMIAPCSATWAGSSPRARGTHLAQGSFQVSERFIPACAGNTKSSRLKSESPPVHPRVRGEHAPNSASNGRRSGSSPRARGTRCRGSPQRPSNRFIPACAGNTRWSLIRRGTLPVHPRVRGEHLTRDLPHLPGDGSSPRARGTLRQEMVCHEERRFIPACAGNTLCVNR